MINNKMDLNLNFFRHISIAFVFFIQSHVSAQVAGHFMKEKQYNVCISTAKGNMILRSQGNGELEACQPYLAWRPSGQEKWNQSYGEKFIVKQQNQNIVEFQTSLAGIEATITAQRIGNNIWEFSGILVNKKPIAIDLARFHYLHGSISGESVGLLAMDGTMAVHNDTLPSSRSAVENLWKSFGVFWPRLPDPIHDSANWAVSLDCGILTTSYTQPGWFAGFTDPGTAFGEIGFKTQTQPSQFFAGILLDNIKVEPGESRTLEKMIIVYGDWQQSLQLWANRCAIELHAPSIKPPVVGYCSWYQHGPNIKPLHMERAIKGVAELPIPPGGRIVQIDDGFEVMPGDWGPSKKFKEAWPALPGKIKVQDLFLAITLRLLLSMKHIL